MKILSLVFLFAFTSQSWTKKLQPVFPIRAPIAFPHTSGSACPSQFTIDEEVRKNRISLQNAHHEFRPCGCGGPGWERVAYYDFSQQDCPSDFSRVHGKWNNATCQPDIHRGYRECHIPGTSSSLALPVEGQSYSSVCGRVIGHAGGAFAFLSSIYCNTSLEKPYVVGASLTHGPLGNRTHIWTFAAAFNDPSSTSTRCPCSNTSTTWLHATPDYVGQDYFCDTEIHKTEGNGFDLNESDPLWDGQGCIPPSACCEFNHPPYFCKHLNYTTSEEMELRIFASFISLVEIFIK